MNSPLDGPAPAALQAHNTRNAILDVLELPREKLDLLKRTVARGCGDDEFALFLHVCKTRRFDPFSKLIYPVKRYDSKLRAEVMALQSSIDSFRLVAERNGKYAGQLGPQWCGEDGAWRDVWLAKGPPAAARVAALRHDFKEPLWTVALWSNYVQTNREGQPTAFWARMGPLMLAKCAEALALRRAFPEDLAGLYTSDEMQQAEIAPREVEAEPAREILHPDGRIEPVSAFPAALPAPTAAPAVTAKPRSLDGVVAAQAKPEPKATPPAVEPPKPEPKAFTTRWESSPGRFMETRIPVGCDFWNLWAFEILPDSSFAAKGHKTWREVSDGSPKGFRHKMLLEAVTWAKANFKDSTPFHERCACTLAVMEWKHQRAPAPSSRTEPLPEEIHQDAPLFQETPGDHA